MIILNVSVRVIIEHIIKKMLQICLYILDKKKKKKRYPTITCNYLWKKKLKADMKSYKPVETAVIFLSSEPFLKQGIS